MATRYWVGGNGNWTSTSRWSTSSGGASGASVPTSTDDVVFDSNSSSGGSLSVAALAGGEVCANLTINNSLFIFNGYLSIYGNLTGTSLDSVAYTGILYFRATSGTKTISMPAGIHLCSLIFDGVGGTWQLNSDIEAERIILTNGTFNSSSYNVDLNNQGNQTNAFSSSNSNTRTLNMGSGVWTVVANWDCTTSTNLTVSASTATLKFRHNSGAGISIASFYGGGKTWPTIVNDMEETSFGSNSLTIYGSNTFLAISMTTTSNPFSAVKRLFLESGATTTVTSSLIITSVSGKTLTLSATSSTQATISAGFGDVSPVTYTNISYSNATGGASFQALLTDGNVDGGNNTGWTFVAPGGGFLAFF